MPEKPKLIPAKPEDLRDALAFALTFDGRKRFRQADELTARIAAEHLVRHLELSGFVVLRRPPAGDLSKVQQGPSGGSKDISDNRPDREAE